MSGFGFGVNTSWLNSMWALVLWMIFWKQEDGLVSYGVGGCRVLGKARFAEPYMSVNVCFMNT